MAEDGTREISSDLGHVNGWRAESAGVCSVWRATTVHPGYLICLSRLYFSFFTCLAVCNVREGYTMSVPY